ncbi:VanW family protein [Eubacteriales bacterium OttesenSCG-928-K08]|nr:VanW family protein [Eubacteriales bacterium OttesenSCG-928-K08]
MMRNKTLTTVFAALLIVLIIVAILSAGLFSTAKSMTSQAGIPDGVRIDGVDVGRMQEENAAVIINDAFKTRAKSTSILVDCEGKTQEFTMEDAGAQIVLDHVFEEIWGITQAEMMDQLDSRLSLKDGYDLYSIVEYDRDKLMSAVKAFCDRISIEAVDASVNFAANDTSGSFSFTTEKSGKTFDTDVLCEKLMDAFVNENYESIAIGMEPVAPTITKTALQEHTVELGSATTIVTGSEQRITNICLITETVNGYVIKSGEVISLNELTGERTPEKGYMEAPAIRYGELIEEIGGGICQLSGTLYLAALRSDLEVVERHHHTWPSDYLPIGMDATITWPSKDLKIRNNTDWPIYIHAYVDDDKLVVTFYGQQINPGLEIVIANDIYETTAAPAPVYQYDPERPVGYRKTLQKEREGYRVKVYRQYYKDGELVNSELIAHDRFYPIAGKYVLGTLITGPDVPDEEK